MQFNINKNEQQWTMVYNFTITQSKQENVSNSLRPFGETYIQNEHNLLSQTSKPTIIAVITLGSQNIV